MEKDIFASLAVTQNFLGLLRNNSQHFFALQFRTEWQKLVSPNGDTIQKQIAIHYKQSCCTAPGNSQLRNKIKSHLGTPLGAASKWTLLKHPSWPSFSGERHMAAGLSGPKGEQGLVIQLALSTLCLFIGPPCKKPLPFSSFQRTAFSPSSSRV